MRWREQLKIVVIGLIAGGGGGLKIHHAVSVPTAWTGASPAFAGNPAPAHESGTAHKSGTLRGGNLSTSAPESPASAPSSALGAARAPRSGTDRTDRIAGYVREPYYYASLGRRDPFASLLEGNFLGDGEVGLVDIGNIKLVGIAWDEIDRFAMVEDGRGFGYVLREGDAIRGGKVLKIARESVTFAQTTAGESSTMTIELPMREGD